MDSGVVYRGRDNSAGNLVNDAHIAAVAWDDKATVVSYDNEFSRFPGVRREKPA